ncbi:MAG: hypothetical protein II824_05580 [Bacteroidales bacterium]|nr:hypothetical protein [Bacteroidales bacterium]
MKTRLTVLSALALVALAACQREATVADNPTYDPEKKTVNTQFIVNVSTGTGSPDTKQTASDTQQSFSDFRGIEAAHVLAYSLDYTGVNGESYLYKSSDASSVATRDFDLGNLVTPTNISETDTRRIIELALPLETNAILIYGKAPKTGDNVNERQGYVDYSGTALNSTLNNVKFQIHTRLTNPTAFERTGDLFGRLLTGIMNAGRVVETAAKGYKMGTGETSRDNTYAFWWPIDDTSKNSEEYPLTGENGTTKNGYTLYQGSQTWKQYGDQYRDDPTKLNALESILGEAYAEVMYLNGTSPKEELRAGSAASVARLVGDMFNVVQRVRNATSASPREYIAQLVAEEAFSRASSFFTYDPATSTMNFKTRAEIMQGVTNYIPDRNPDYYSSVLEDAFYYKPISTTDTRTAYPGFPLNLHLPMGAAIMKFIEVGPEGQKYRVVLYETNIPTYGMGDSSTPFAIENYLYPAELVYYTNSSIRTSDTAAERNNYPATPGLWSDSGNWTTSMWTGNKVSSTTRSVAVSKPINYGTALLKSQFAYNTNEIEDNNAGVHNGEANNKIKVDGNNEPFLVSGIIIGGVDKSVGWDFLPNGDGFKYFIYDNLGGEEHLAIPKYSGDASTLSYSSPVYTCTWDNYDSTLGDDAQSKVYIGLELVNNTGMDIWGELNLIRNGGTFYLVAELDPTKDAALTNLKKGSVVNLTRSDFYYPPFDASGATKNAPRVFMQDYVTSAKFIFGKESLKHAYVTMPDLRAGQVSLGLSVDLTWQPGLEFTSVMGNVSSGN